MRRPHERSLIGRLGMAAVLVVLAGAVVVGVGAMAKHAPVDSTRVSAESTTRPTPQASPSADASPSPASTRHATHGKPLTPSSHHAHRGSKAPHTKRKAHRGPVFAGVSQVLLKDSGTHLCADLPDYGKGTINGHVRQFTCTYGATDNQVWTLSAVDTPKAPTGGHVFEIRNVKDELCMDLGEYGARPAGTGVAEYPCHPTTADNQLWYLSTSPAGNHRIHNLASHGLCLGPRGRTAAKANADLEIHACGRGDFWTWPRG